MSEVLFRGKRVDNGEWVYGGFAVIEGAACIIKRQLEVDEELQCELPAYVVVEEETVGQYTGITDRNGAKIFDDDVVERVWAVSGRKPVKINYRVMYTNARFDLISIQYKAGMKYMSIMDCGTTTTIVGNIHDNPELLDALKLPRSCPDGIYQARSYVKTALKELEKVLTETEDPAKQTKQTKEGV